MLTRADCLSLLHITQWVSRPVVSACWVTVKNIVILVETENLLGNLSLQEKNLFRAIFKAFSLPEDALEKARLFKLEAGSAQFKPIPALIWVWGERVGRLLAAEHNVDTVLCPLVVSPSLRRLLKSPVYKRHLWDDGRCILKKFLQQKFLCS